MKIWVVVAAYNEAERLGETLRGLLACGYEVAVVDDGSTDESGAVAAAYPVSTLRHPVNRGQGAALRTGIGFAVARGAEVVVTFDADGQHDPLQVASLLEPIVEGRADIVLGSRFLGLATGLPWSRRVVLRAARAFTRLFSRTSVSDPHNGFRALSRSAAQAIRITQDRMAHASEIVDEIRANHLRWCEVPVTVRYTPATLAKGQTSWGAFRIIGDLLAGRLNK
jgi:polyprenyl-phospho-N-acetylgalactosaminyl synthase